MVHQSLFNSLDTLDFFSKLSGLKINSSKTKVVLIGSRKFSDQVFHHTRWKLDWGSTTFNLLGIELCVELDKITELNYNMQLPKILSLIQQWNRRILTSVGRVTVAKTLILPKLNHLFISLSTPNEAFLSSLNRAIFNFLWKSKVDKVKRQIVTQDYTKGGLRMLDVYNLFLLSNVHG